MAADIVAFNYDAMKGIQSEFSEASRQVQAISNDVQRQIDVLQEGKNWQAVSATKYYQDMDNDVMPAIQRLIRALARASEVCGGLATNYQSGEEEATNMIPNNFG